MQSFKATIAHTGDSDIATNAVGYEKHRSLFSEEIFSLRKPGLFFKQYVPLREFADFLKLINAVTNEL